MIPLQWRFAIVVIFGSLVGCQGSEDPATPNLVNANDGGLEGGAAGAGGAAGSGPDCNAMDLASCEYHPAVVTTPGPRHSAVVSYTDILGETRTLEVEVRLPSAGTALPVIVWSHGGPHGLASATKVGDEWGEVFNSAGYAFVAIAHATRERPSYDALCAAIGIPAADCKGAACLPNDNCDKPGPSGVQKGECLADPTTTSGYCSYFKHLSYDRPQDARAVFDWLALQSASGAPLDGKLDLSRLVYAGHSSGAGSAFMVAGATRQFGGVNALYMDPRPIAFISASPQGPGEEDFTEDSYTGAGCQALAADPSECLTRPHLALTGVGDQTDATDPVGKKQCIELAPPGDKYLAWLTTADATHEYFDLNPEACASNDPARCAAIKTWLTSAAVAFLDANVRDTDAAREYLASDRLLILSGGELELTAR